MRILANRIVTFVALIAFAVPVALALVFSFDVEIRNKRDVAVKIELNQYHSAGFNGTRPLVLTDDLRIKTETVEIPPGDSRFVRFDSGTGRLAATVESFGR